MDKKHPSNTIVWMLGLLQGVALIILSFSHAEEVLHIYGPGGPYPAINEAAEVFGERNSIRIEVLAGPTSKWLEKAKADADLIYSGAEFMMTDFIRALDGRIDETTVTPLYLRPSAILVRPGNPKHIWEFTDLLKPGVKILVVSGAGQTGMWEDAAAKQGDIQTVREFRNNIYAFAKNSAEAKKLWIENRDIDAWFVWNIWRVSNPTLADLVPVGDDYVIYRDCGIALTHQGKRRAMARKFVEFLQSSKGARIFAKWGWITSENESNPVKIRNDIRVVLPDKR